MQLAGFGVPRLRNQASVVQQPKDAGLRRLENDGLLLGRIAEERHDAIPTRRGKPRHTGLTIDHEGKFGRHGNSMPKGCNTGTLPVVTRVYLFGYFDRVAVATPTTRDGFDRLVEDLLVLDRKLATHCEVVIRTTAARRGDGEAGEVAARGAAVARRHFGPKVVRLGEMAIGHYSLQRLLGLGARRIPSCSI